ncbi:MAG: ABC transporter permease, partial [Bryobacterales bacterium]|nr:ABC transporter permease [Bryobacterales bacterium]
YLPELPLLDPVSLNGFVFGGVAVACTMIAMAFAVLPVAAMRNIDFVAAVRGGAQQTASQRGVRWRRWLVATQIAASVVLLGNTLLLARSFQRVLSTDPGFDPHHTLTFGLGIPESRYDTDAKMAAFHAGLEDRLQALPQVEAVSGVVGLPMSGGSGRARFLLPGDADSVQRPMRMSIVGTGYLRAMRIPLLAGRNFTLDDRLGKPGVVMINQTMAKQHFAGRDPVGERIRISWRTPSYPKGSEFEIIGVVGDTRQGTLEQQILPQVYANTAQLPTEGGVYVIRTAASAETLAPSVSNALASIDPALERIQLRPMTERLDATLRNRRVSLVLVGGFAGLALLLALAGVGSLLSFLAVQRRKEFGIRVALGDSPQGLAALVLRQAAALATTGLTIGLPMTVAVAQWIGSQLHETSPLEATVYVAVVAVILAMALFAAAIPAWRAARVDPATILRSDG